MAKPKVYSGLARRMRLLCVTLIASMWAVALQAADPPTIRQVASQHLTLYTDLPADEEIDALPGLFDQAFSQWCAYFGRDEKQHATWKLRACLMQSRKHFAASGLLPADLPNFRTGFARDDQIWLDDQTSVYYRRHLLLHEGTHAFMALLMPGMGPPWYAEGMAELLATHRLEDGQLTLNYFPRDREEVPKWGRIEMVQTAFDARQPLTLERIFAYDSRAHSQNEAYGWCWAAAAFFDGHPRYRERFRKLPAQADKADFARRVEQLFAADRARLNEDWQLYVANIDYGYDFSRMEMELAAGKPLPATGERAKIAADRGWQASGVRVEAGKKYTLRASGRYQIAERERPWPCEPGGITIHYYHGLPLGVLLAGVRGDGADTKGITGLLRPQVVGLRTTITPAASGTLYLRVNDSAGQLADNSGSLSVEITSE